MGQFSVGLNSVNNSPTKSDRSITSRFSVQDGEVVTFAGLNQNTSNGSSNRLFGFNIGKSADVEDTQIVIFVEVQRI